MNDKDSIILALLRDRRKAAGMGIKSSKKIEGRLLWIHRKHCYTEASKWIRMAESLSIEPDNIPSGAEFLDFTGQDIKTRN